MGILAGAVLLFITEWVRVDLVALIVLVSLVFTGLLTPAEAVSGFSNPAVITIWAVLILSAGLSRTGVAKIVGDLLARFAGSSEKSLILLTMAVAALLSAVMNNIAVAALLLPVVIDLCRRTGLSTSKILIPMAFASLMGGLTTLIGTPPNIIVSEAMRSYGLEPFNMFDYTPVGLAVTLAGIVFLIVFSSRLLPKRDQDEIPSTSMSDTLHDFFRLHEKLYIIEVPEDSVLGEKTLTKSRLGAALGINVIAIIRNGETILAPDAKTTLEGGDKLLAGGSIDRLLEIRGRSDMFSESEMLSVDEIQSVDEMLLPNFEIAEVFIQPGAKIFGKTIEQVGFRNQYGIYLMGINKKGRLIRSNLPEILIEDGDSLVVFGPKDNINKLREHRDYSLSQVDKAAIYSLFERLMALQIPEDSSLVGKTLYESRLGRAFDLSILGIKRDGETNLMPSGDEVLLSGDTLLVDGDVQDLFIFRGLQELSIQRLETVNLEDIESDQIGLVEAVVSPHTSLLGKTLRQIRFRKKFGLTVLAIRREGKVYRSNLNDMALKFGDDLLLYGDRENFIALGTERDFLVLTEIAQLPPRSEKAPFAVLIMSLVLLSVILGILPIVIAAVAGVVLMVLTGCLNMEEAYESIEWKAIFLIAGMLPLGIALENTGAAQLIAQQLVAITGGYGPLAVTAGIFILATASSQFLPNPAVAVLLIPIAYNAATSLGVSPYPMLMTVAISASAAFLSPVGHPVNLLVMGPGGYKFGDYYKIGLPLTIVVFVVLLITLPIFWPFY
jgi:di/tricarboxylate transporter